MQNTITEYVVRILITDLPQEYYYYDQQQVIKVLKTLKALKKNYMYEVNVHTLH
jgi:hypothetical protein